LESVDRDDGLAGSASAGGGEYLKLAFEVVRVIRHALKVLGGERVCACAVVGVHRDSAVFSYLDVGVNVGYAQMDGEVCRAFAVSLILCEALCVDC
jgi:hypothetical protein